MRTETVVDTVALQINFYNEDKRDTARYDIVNRLKEYRQYISDKECKLYTDDDILFEYKYKPVATIDTGSFSYLTKEKKRGKTVWYLSIKLAGLKRYIAERDKMSHNVLMLIVSYLNTYKMPFKITQLDVALNLFTKFKNTLCLCTSRYATTKYWKANEEQQFDTTRYIEKFNNAKHKAESVVHACHYDKSYKEKLDYNLTRFEISFQKKFLKNGFNIGAIYGEFNRYHVMYVPNPKVKQEVMDKYDRLAVIRQKDIKALKLERYRLNIDMNVLVDFTTNLYLVDDSVVEQFMNSPEMTGEY